MATFDEHLDGLKAIYEDQRGRITALNDTVDYQKLAIAEQQAVIDAQKARIAELEAVVNPPATVKTYLGSCPEHLDPAQVVDKFGEGIAVLWFDNSRGLTLKPPRPPKEECPHFHACWKSYGTITDISKLTDPDLDTLVANALSTLLPGDAVTLENEADVKYKKDVKDRGEDEARRALNARMANQRRFHESVKRVRPDISTCVKVAAWRFTAGDSPDMFMAHGDVLGVDLDGIKTSYYNFAEPTLLARIVSTADRYYGGRWSAPEFGWPLQASDPTGSVRRAQIATQVERILAMENPPESLMWFDNDATQFAGYKMSTADVELWNSFRTS